MMSGRTSEGPSTTSNCERTNRIVAKLKQLPDGWGGEKSKKPSAKAIRRLKKTLTVLESSHMPWPTVTAVSNGGFLLSWISLTRDLIMTVDPVGDMQFGTALKRIDATTTEVVDRIDSEGIVTDMITFDQLIAWYSLDQAHST